MGKHGNISNSYNTANIKYNYKNDLKYDRHLYEQGFLGGITGGSLGMINCCYNTGTMELSYEPTQKDQQTKHFGAAGIAGGATGVIKNSYNTGDIICTKVTNMRYGLYCWINRNSI